jgi:iron complex transport system ATP-binding protein
MSDVTPLLQIDGATVVKGGVRLLDNLSLQIASGEHTAILGPNGSGKSSLIKLITRRYYPLAASAGRPKITLFGRDRWDIFEMRSLLGIVSADLHQEFVGVGGLTGTEAVLSGFFAGLGLAAHHTMTPEMIAHTQDALAQVEALPFAEKPMEQLSTGEARRILIARALAAQPRALLLDEPTTGLDLLARRRFLETLRQIARCGTTILLVTHHVEEILPEIGRVVLMQSGKVFRNGPKEDVLTSGNLSALYGAPVEVTEWDGWYAAQGRF